MTSDRQHRRLYRNYLIKRRFQLKWVSAILAASLGVFVVLSLYIYFDEKHRTDSNVALAIELGHDPEIASVAAADSEDADRAMLWILLTIGTGMIVLLAGLGIRLTHRVAGPVYALGMFMEQVRAGDWRRPRSFRKDDEFQELAESFQELVETLRENEASKIEQLETIQSSGGLSADAIATLHRLIESKRKHLG